MPKQYTGADKTEWSYIVSLDDLGREPKTYHFTADAQQRADLARRFGILSLEEASAVVTLSPAGGGTIHAMGTVRAQATQACVVTLVPVATQIDEEFEGWFGDADGGPVSFTKAKVEREAKKGPVEVEVLDESVDPEPIIGGKINIGELAAQYLSLGLEPYPRAPDAPPVQSFGPDEQAAPRKSPFEALKDWKEKR
jgi:hypothetical protein